MDAMTLYAIVTMANGTPTVVRYPVAEQCERYSSHFRAKYPAAVVWCRSEIDPPKPVIGDYIQRDKVVEYRPDFVDMLGMPSDR